MIDQITENLIHLYLKYSDSKSINVDEFVKIRSCAREECENISYSSYSIKEEQKQKPLKAVNKMVKKSVDSDNIASNIRQEEEVDILSILKSVED